jgi:hypothetical protein
MFFFRNVIRKRKSCFYYAVGVAKDYPKCFSRGGISNLDVFLEEEFPTWMVF